MGAGIGATLVGAGRRVSWASSGRGPSTVQRARAAGLVDVHSVQAMAETCDLIISVCPPSAALDVARQVAGFGGTYLDANAIAARDSPGGGRPGGAVRRPLRRRWHHRRPARPLELTAPVPLGPIGSLGPRRVRRHHGAGPGDLRGPGRRVGLENVLCRLDERDDRAAPRRARPRRRRRSGGPASRRMGALLARPGRAEPARSPAGGHQGLALGGRDGADRGHLQVRRTAGRLSPGGGGDLRQTGARRDGRRRRRHPGDVLRAVLEWPRPD